MKRRLLALLLALALAAPGCLLEEMSLASRDPERAPDVVAARCDGASLPPLADAGADREVLRGFPTLLDASATYHPLGCPMEVLWAQELVKADADGTPVESARVTLSNPTHLRPTFTAPPEVQVLTFVLTASSGTLRTVDRVRIHVVEEVLHTAPLARAAADPVTGGDAPGPAALGPTDPYSFWTVVEPNGELAPYEEAPEPRAARVLRLETTDDTALLSAPDHVVLWRPDEAPQGPLEVRASVTGPERVGPGEPIVLELDGVAEGLTAHWTQPGGDPLPQIGGFGAKLELNAPSAPQVLRVRVELSRGGVRAMPVFHQITVTAGANNAPPRAEAGPERHVHGGRAVMLDGSGSSDPDGDPLTYTWWQTFGAPAAASDAMPAGGSRFGLRAPDLAETDLTELTLVFALIVRDGQAESAPDTVVVRVVADEWNQPPHARAGDDREVDPGDRVVLDASDSFDTEGDTLAAFTWRLEPPAASGLVLDPENAAVATFVADAPGSAYTATVEVCDDLGACAEDAVEITVTD